MRARAKSNARPGPFPPNRVRELRLARGLSQVALGELAGLDSTSVHRLEHLTRELTWDAAVRLSAALGVTPGALYLPPHSLPPALALARKLAAVQPRELALARKLAAMPPRKREACVRLAREIAAREGGQSIT